MPQTTQNKVGVWLKNYDNTFSSYYPSGDKPIPTIPIAFTGVNVGGEPDVLISEYWQDAIIGSRLPLGNWTDTINGTSSDENYRPKIFALGSTRGAGSRSVTGANEMTGFKKTFPSLTKNIFAAWQMGIPAGYYFSGASAVETLPPASNLKMLWVFDTAHGGDLNDLVLRSRNNPNDWFVGGNHANAQDYTGGQVDWNTPMSFSTYRKPDPTNSYLNNGVSRAYQAFSTGLELHTKTDAPIFSRRTLLTFTVQNNAVYTVTINGTDCTYTSDSDATGTEIANGLKADINSKRATWGGQECGGAPPNIEIIPNSGTVPTVSATGNITVRHALDGYQYLETIWQGNQNQVNTLHVYPYIYVAGGDNAGNYVMLADSAAFDSTMKKFIVVPHTAWVNGVSCEVNPSDTLREGMTHAHLFKDGIPVDVKQIQVQNLTITGTGFGTKPTQSPEMWETFDGGVGELVKDYDATWVGYNSGIGAAITNSAARFAGQKSAYSNPDRGGDFLTNHKAFTPTDKVYLSMWVNVVSPRPAQYCGGVTKFQRINSTVGSGGGGVYNGVGVHSLGGASPNNWFPAWTGSEGTLNNLGYFTEAWYPLNTWRRVEYEIQLNDVDVANGFHNVHVDRFGSKLSGNIMQRRTGFSSANWLLDSTLLGVESPNQKKFYKPNVLLANTDYTVTVSGTPYTYNSGTVPTMSQIVNGLSSLLTAAGRFNEVYNNESLAVDVSLTSTYTSNFTKEPAYDMHVAEILLDRDLKRIYIGNANTWAACTETNPQPYSQWSDTQITIQPHVGGIVGSKFVYKQLTPNTTPILIGELVGNHAQGWTLV
jgi:hypothetical protein